jgi:dipeptide/tripeptide permease
MAVVIVFCGAYERNGNTIALWADAGIDHHIIGRWFFPLTWFQALYPLMISLLTPPLVAHWTCLAKRGREPSSVRKMVTGAVVTAAAYSIIAMELKNAAAAHAHAAQRSAKACPRMGSCQSVVGGRPRRSATALRMRGAFKAVASLRRGVRFG